jgi:RNA polymerase-binding transcription factor DksA
MENIALFSEAQVAEAVSFAPAQVIVAGLTTTEKKLSVVRGASVSALMYIGNQKGKVGKYAREEQAMLAEGAIAKHARGGNYVPLAQAIAALTGQSLSIRNRSEFESLSGRFEDALRDLKNGGYTVCKKTGVEKSSSKRNVLMQVIGLITEVQSIAASL